MDSSAEKARLAALAKSKKEFIEVLRKQLTPEDTCRRLKVKRQEFEAWKRVDPQFREECEMVELAIIDKIKRIVYQKTGLLTAGPNSHKWKNDQLLIAMLKREQNVTNINVNNHPAPLEIKGLDPSIIANLTAPPASAPTEPKENNQIKVEMAGVPLKAPPTFTPAEDPLGLGGDGKETLQ